MASEWIIAPGVVRATLILAASGVWVFHSGPDVSDRSVPRVILSDRVTLGLIRLLIAVAAVYGLASIAILVRRGRWVRSISTTGIEADASIYTDGAISEMEEELTQLRSERDQLKGLLSRGSDG